MKKSTMPVPSPAGPEKSPASGKAWVLWILGLALMAVWLVRGSQSSVPSVDYSEFKRRVGAGEITQVELGKERIVATDKQGAKLTTARVDDPSLPRDLDEKKIPYRGKVESDWGNLFGMLLFFFAPILVVWFLIGRRMRPGAGMMAIGKTRAKL